MNIKNFLTDVFKNRVEEFKNKTAIEIVNILWSEEEGLRKHYGDLKKDSFRRIVSKHINKTFTTQNVPKEIKTPYKVVKNTHYFFPIKGEFSLPNEIVDKLFYSFSKHGLNLSTTQVINKFNLEPWQWHALKNALKLYKDSNIFSPHTVESTDPEEMKELVREKLNERINTLGYIVEDEYNKTIISKYKEVIKKSTIKDLELTTLLTELQDLLPKVELNTYAYDGTPSDLGDNLIVVIADLHFGLNNSNSDQSPEFSVNTLKNNLNRIAQVVNEFRDRKIHVLNLGDIIESFQGNNHIGSWKGLESGYYGSRLVIECYKTIVEFLASINNLASYSQIPGNHDRSSSDNKEDVEGFISKIVFEFIRNSFSKSSVEFFYDDVLLSRKIGNINYIITHGHLGISKCEPSELILEYTEDPKAFTVLLQGHLHDRKIKKDHKMFRSIIAPAIMPGNNYSVVSGYSGNPGFLILLEDCKKPIVIDYSL